MTTVTDVLTVARAEIGTVGGSKYQKAHGVSSGAWCAYFATWALRAAGLADGPWTGWTPGLVTWAKGKGLWKTSDPKPGDLVLYMWAGVSTAGRGTPPVCHVGIVEYVVADGIYAIEGNTSGTAAGSQYNGNIVARRHRTSNVVGYVDLQGYYGGQTSTTTSTTASSGTGIAEDGVRGAETITRWQQVMGTPVDGTISKPSALIKADQSYLNSVVAAATIQSLTGAKTLATDGIEGAKTIKVRQFWLFNQQAQAVLGRAAKTSDFDGIAGAVTTRLHQHALNAATVGSGRY